MSLEFYALAVSTIAIVMSVYIAWKNRRYALAKEEYFNLQRIAETIISRLLFLRTHSKKYKVYLETARKSVTFDDDNDTFNTSNFKKDIHDVAALIFIYFRELGDDWNLCLDCIAKIDGITTTVKKHYVTANIVRKTVDWKTADWNKVIEQFNTNSNTIESKSEKIADSIKKALVEFKKDNL